MNILFLISHQPNPRFVKQINFLAKENTVSLAHFQRETLANLDKSISKEVITYNFGGIPNFFSHPVKRIWVYIKTIMQLKKLFKKADYDLILLNNMDVLLLYLFSRPKITKGNRIKPKIAIEISDLREYVFKTGPMAKLMRNLERTLYKKYIDKLIVTSKKYHSFHFGSFFNKDVFVLENKLLSGEIKKQENLEVVKSKKTIIGIVGLLLRKNEYVELFETYKGNTEVEIHVYGKGYYQYIVEEYASVHPNIIYHGPYNAFLDTERIYRSIDIIYLIYDTDQQSLNNKLALPNKLYECMHYKVPLLCSKGTYLEEIVAEHGIGLAIEYKEPGQIQKGVEHLMDSYEQVVERLNGLQENLYLADNDYVKLEAFLKN